MLGLDTRIVGAAVVLQVDSGEWESVERMEAVRRQRMLERDHASPPVRRVVLNKPALGSTLFAVGTSIVEYVQVLHEQEIVNVAAGEADYTAKCQISKTESLKVKAAGR